MKLIDVQIDRVVGPTHHFGGLGVGNVASKKNQGVASNPKLAALQGLDKMRLVAELGVPQMILPPQPRPDERFLESLGFADPDCKANSRIEVDDPGILSAAMSSSAMWTANAATVASSVDGNYDCVVLTVANLNSSLHRAIEPSQTLADLWQSFPHSVLMLEPLHGGTMMRDEGAANHMRLGSGDAKPGIHVFVYGDHDPMPGSFFPRQSRAACEAIARLHRLPRENTFFLKQHPMAVDAGAFHNDVVAASHHGLLLHQEFAFYQAEQELERISQRYEQIYDEPLTRIEVPDSVLPLKQAVETYLFNSQIVSVDHMNAPVIICPAQVNETETTKKLLHDWCTEGLFGDSHFIDLRQSMSGGGGPACLRLRIPLTEKELAGIPVPNQWTPVLHDALTDLIEELYPESVSVDELSSPELHKQAAKAEKKIRQVLRHR